MIVCRSLELFFLNPKVFFIHFNIHLFYCFLFCFVFERGQIVGLVQRYNSRTAAQSFPLSFFVEAKTSWAVSMRGVQTHSEQTLDAASGCWTFPHLVLIESLDFRFGFFGLPTRDFSYMTQRDYWALHPHLNAIPLLVCLFLLIFFTASLPSPLTFS